MRNLFFKSCVQKIQVACVLAGLAVSGVAFANDSSSVTKKSIEDAIARTELSASQVVEAEKAAQLALGKLIEHARLAMDQKDNLSEKQLRSLIKAFAKAAESDRGNELALLLQELLSDQKDLVTKILNEEDKDFDLRKALDRLGKS